MAWIYFLWFVLPSFLLNMVRIGVRPIVFGGVQRTVAFVGITLLVFVAYYAQN